ncbi:unnamed protein product [Cunninghamella echinulata]
MFLQWVLYIMAIVSLVTSAKKQCDHVALTIFVNPAQFAPTEDLSTYPRTIQKDLDQLASLGPGVTSAVLVPTVNEMYPNGIELDVAKQTGTFVEVKGLSHQLEGVTRPHFFRGVATVVSKFLNIVQPEEVFFGQKDVQQCAVIKAMIRDLHFPVKLNICPTIRETDGLAMSSRNAYLTPDQRRYALAVYKALSTIETLYHSGQRHAPTLIQEGKKIIEEYKQQAQKENMEWDINLDYLSINSPNTLAPISQDVDSNEGCIVSTAVFVGKTRLIDNILLDVKTN